MTKLNITPTKRVGLIFLSGENTEIVAHLEKRQKTPGGKITWQGVHVATVGGKIRDGENELTALCRLLKEKFGQFMTMWIITTLVENGPESQTLFKNDRITLFGFKVKSALLTSIHPRMGRDGFSRITVEDMSQIVLAEKSWKHQPHNKEGIVVFPEVNEALEKAFGKL
ncbi:MAG: hypothetical protein KGI49_02650 [Patescibacteria group bacterium]|nr:hypothetical protein [Patescibacteria group bacterium]